MVLAPEHPLVAQITSAEQQSAVADYKKACAAKSDMERGDLNKDKSGVFTGAYAVNPVNGEQIPVWIADYVMMGYGTGAIMAVPAHDERDFEFAKKFSLPIIQVVSKARSKAVPALSERVVSRHAGENRIPHWNRDQSIYAVTFRLDDSVPVNVRDAWKEERESLRLREESGDITREESERLKFLISEKVEAYLDAGHGSCNLKDPSVAAIVAGALNHFDGARYRLDAWCVMPNHVHAVLEPLTGYELSDIVHSWKSFTAHEINKLAGRKGTVWQADFYSRIIRDWEEYDAQRRYVAGNPGAAGLKDWEWAGMKDVSEINPQGRDGLATALCEDGTAVNSGFLDGLPTAEAKQKMIAWLEEKGLGKRRVQFKLRDWLFSRQRYWGEPFPIVWEGGEHRGIPESELPLLQPDLADFKPTGDPRGPLIKATDWIRYSETAQRETNTMPQWAGSCWYYLRYCDPKNSERLIGEAAEKYWMGGGKPGGVDLYVGGTEHAVLHLLYARFWHKVLFDFGYVSTPEPFQRLVNQGMVLGEDSQKMSKSRGNVVTTYAVTDEYGADSLRLYEMFMGPLEQVKPWSMKGVEGVSRFLARVWRLASNETESGWTLSGRVTDTPCTDKALRRVVHETIRKVGEDVEKLSFNTAISQMMICTNAFTGAASVPLQEFISLLLCLNPFAPHISEEIHARLREAFPQLDARQLCQQTWPQFDPAALVVDEIEIVVQVNGKLRDKVTVATDADNAAVEAAALAAPRVKEAIGAGTVAKVIVVPKKLVNVVVK
jgi:leucyl-tRNA synthetase